MKIEFKQADTTDAELLVEIYNASFYNDYMKYGECPAYGKTKEAMEKSIINYPKFLILCDGSPVGCVSCKKIEERGYEVEVQINYNDLEKLNYYCKNNNILISKRNTLVNYPVDWLKIEIDSIQDL